MRFRALPSACCGLLFLACLVFRMVGFHFVPPANGATKLRDQDRSDIRASEQYQDKKYHNQRFNFSFEYPDQWKINEAFNGGGVRIAPKQGTHMPLVQTLRFLEPLK